MTEVLGVNIYSLTFKEKYTKPSQDNEERTPHSVTVLQPWRRENACKKSDDEIQGKH